MLFRCAFLFTVLTACVPVRPRVPEGSAADLTFWAESDPRVPRKTYMEACAYWEPMGFQCRRVDDPAKARITIRLIEGPCPTRAELGRRMQAEGRPPLADPLTRQPGHDLPAAAERTLVAGVYRGGGAIEHIVACSKAADGLTIDAESVRVGIAHEIGHYFRLAHVPVDCDDSTLVYPLDVDGKPICGDKAVMNPAPARVARLSDLDRALYRASRKK